MQKPAPAPSSPANEPAPASASAAELDRRMARITQIAGIGYWSFNRRTRLGRWSPELRALHGLAPDDPLPTVEQWLQRFVHPDDRERTREVLGHWMAGSTAVVQHALRLLRPNGQACELLTHSLAEISADTDLRYGVVIDVTPLRRAEQALRKAEGRAALTASAMGLGSWETDLATGVVHWDTPMWLLRGRAPRNGTPTVEDRRDSVHPDDLDHVAASNRGGVPANYEFRVVWPDGRVRWLAARSMALHDEQGRPVRRIGVNWDITAHRQAEAALREREIALHEADTRTRTLARMSHELRTPLNAILGCTHLLQGAGVDPAQQQRHLAEIEAAGHQLLRLVDQVLQLTARGDSGATPPVAAVPPAGTRRSLLYIEDNAVNAMIVSELVARRGDIDVLIAETGATGLHLALERQPALVLLDMQLPDMDGLEVFRRLRADTRTAALPCIAVSANAMKTDIDAALAAGMSDYWTKPLDFRAFGQALEALFGPAPPR